MWVPIFVYPKAVTNLKNSQYFPLLLHQSSIKFHIFIANKAVDLSLDIQYSRKALKALLQNMYLMLELLYHKGNTLIMAVVDGSIFKKILVTIT